MRHRASIKPGIANIKMILLEIQDAHIQKSIFQNPHRSVRIVRSNCCTIIVKTSTGEGTNCAETNEENAADVLPTVIEMLLRLRPCTLLRFKTLLFEVLTISLVLLGLSGRIHFLGLNRGRMACTLRGAVLGKSLLLRCGIARYRRENAYLCQQSRPKILQEDVFQRNPTLSSKTLIGAVFPSRAPALTCSIAVKLQIGDDLVPGNWSCIAVDEVAPAMQRFTYSISPSFSNNLDINMLPHVVALVGIEDDYVVLL